MESWAKTWNRCKIELENNLPPAIFFPYIAPLKADPQVAGVTATNLLILHAPNRYVKSKVCASYQPHITNIITKLTSLSLPQVDIRVSPVTLDPRSTTERASPTPPSIKISPHQASRQSKLNPEFTFDNFIVGVANSRAHEAAMRVVSGALEPSSQNNFSQYSSLVLYGGIGFGKTHLMHAIGHKLQDAGVSLLIEDTHDLMSALVEGIETKSIRKVSEWYASHKMLLIDDVHFLSTGKKLQEEALALFKKMARRGHQVVVTCDRNPKKIDGLQPPLISRLTGGVSAVIDALDQDTKVSILIQAIEKEERLIKPKVALQVVREMPACTTGRDLIGLARRICCTCKDKIHSFVDIDEVYEAAADLITKKTVTIRDVQEMVALHYQLTTQALLSKQRNRAIVRPRQIAMTLTRDLTSHSYPEIGAAFGGRNHTTVVHACKKVDQLKQADPKIQEDIKTLTHKITATHWNA